MNRRRCGDVLATLGRLTDASSTRYFNGMIDEFAIYNYALDDPNSDGVLTDSKVASHVAAIPEPGTAAVAAVMTTGLLLRRRRRFQ